MFGEAERAMPTGRREYRSDRGLWLLFGLLAFAGGGVLLPVPFGKSEVRYWELVWAALRVADKLDALVFVAVVLIFWGLVLAVPAVAIGWLAQAVLVVCGIRLTGRTDVPPVRDYREPDTAEPVRAPDRGGGK
jgi:hypothetical protein